MNKTNALNALYDREVWLSDPPRNQVMRGTLFGTGTGWKVRTAGGYIREFKLKDVADVDVARRDIWLTSEKEVS